ncbi:alpha-amylase family glycosyl hydrolase, partial [Akkermansiaceae bacterium]|nr:alpha-amylase family glycosyl hydrolase [Akkermansiaceae bacterium]
MNFLKTLIISLFAFSGTLRGEVILQYFNTSWAEIEARMPELAEAGYDSLWLPPPFKAGAGAYSVGFDTFDRFDLGDIDQSGSLPTKYGTKGDLIRLMEVAHRFGIRVYFDNVMAHNAGHLNPATQPGELFPEVPGFVPEDFHIGWNGTGWQKFADWPDWNNEWEVLNRNPFAWDIANENGDNLSFDANGLLEGSTYGKRTLIRHPGMTDRYPDLGLSINNPQTDDTMHPFADKEPYQDFGIDGVAGNGDTGEGNGKFDFTDSNSNGQHDLGEASEPFTDTGIDPSVSWRQTAAFGFGDGIYNMGDPVEEDVNGMLYRAVRWFIDQASPDGFRLDAVKHVPDSFFGKQSGDDKDYVNWGYNGAIQEQ